MGHIEVRDAHGTPVKVQIFHSHFFDFDEQVNYILGVRELGDQSRLVLQELDSYPTGADPLRVATSQGRVATSQGSGVSMDSASSSDGLSLIPVDISSGAEIGVWVDAMSANLRITGCTPEFLQISGPQSDGAGLLSWFCQPHRAKIQKWLQYYLNAQHHAFDIESPYTLPCVDFQSQHMSMLQEVISADLVCRIDQKDVPQEAHDSSTVFLVFMKMRRRRKTRRCKATSERGANVQSTLPPIVNSSEFQYPCNEAASGHSGPLTTDMRALKGVREVSRRVPIRL